MPANGVVLLSGNLAGQSTVSTALFWEGGRSSLVVNASVYQASGLQLQLQGPGGAWINIGSSIVSDQVFPFDAPPGQYRLANQVSSSIVGVNAVLVTVPYM